jgi:hypothetical protein
VDFSATQKIPGEIGEILLKNSKIALVAEVFGAAVVISI